MSKINIRGVIVPSNYDLEWTKQYIDRGIITPESYVRRQIEQANPDEPLTVYINSPGGSVFAAYEIINDIVAYRMTAKHPVSIVIGAMAASAASAIAILSNATIKVHRNSKMMFHGAWTETVGGSEAHKDTADLLDKINADIKTALVSKFNIEPEKVDGWFSEGRAGWITAEDALMYGMASGVVDADDEEIDITESDVSNIGEHGLAIAAFARPVDLVKADNEKTEEAKTDDGGESGESDDEGGGDQGGESDPADEPAEGQTEQNTEDQQADEPVEAMYPESEVELRVQLRLADLTAQLAEKAKEYHDLAESKEQARRKAQGEYDKAIADHAKQIKQFEERLAKMQGALEQANARNRKLTLGSLSFSPAIESWSEALAACGGDYVKARTQYPDVYRSYMNNQPRRK